jgi:hypothetical protein
MPASRSAPARGPAGPRCPPGASTLIATLPLIRSSMPGHGEDVCAGAHAESVARFNASAAAEGMARITWMPSIPAQAPQASVDAAQRPDCPRAPGPTCCGCHPPAPTTRQSGLRSSSRTSIAPPRAGTDDDHRLARGDQPAINRCSFHMRQAARPPPM